MRVTQACIGRFHHFHLARQLENFGLLDRIYSGYPKFKLKDEKGISSSRIHTFPWLHAPYMAKNKFSLLNYEALDDAWRLADQLTFDSYVAKKLKNPTILIALSGSAVKSGNINQNLGGRWICDRGSSHIEFQNSLLEEEYSLWGIKYRSNSPKIMERECIEYELSDFITVPSKFVYDSFIQKGVPESKLVKIPYGANLARFSKKSEPDENEFSVLWVGNVSIRKGFLYALDAFQKLKFKNKRFTVIGNIEENVKSKLKSYNLTNVYFKGTVSNELLADYYSSHHVFVLPSIEEGLAMVQGEALACGCPVIATANTGSEDLFDDGHEGFRVPIRDSTAILNSFEKMLDTPEIRKEMSNKALEKVKVLGGWDTYGAQYKQFLSKL